VTVVRVLVVDDDEKTTPARCFPGVIFAASGTLVATWFL
jgi:hypothetical protein